MLIDIWLLSLMLLWC